MCKGKYHTILSASCLTGLYLIKQVNLLLIQLIPSKLNRSLVQCTSHYEVSYYYLETLYLQPHKWKETERKKTCRYSDRNRDKEMYYVANKVVFTGVQILRDPGSNTEYNPDPSTYMCGQDRAMENKKMRMI